MLSLRRRLSRAAPFALFSDARDGDTDSDVVDDVDDSGDSGENSTDVEQDFEESHRTYRKMLKDGAFNLLRLWTHSLRRVRLFFNPNGVLYSDWEAASLFEWWCNEYDKTYPSEQEKLYRVNVFKSYLECMYHENQRRGHPVGHNSWDDLTEDEIGRLLFLPGTESDTE